MSNATIPCSSNTVAVSPFGAYTGPTSSIPPPRSQLTQRRKSTNFRKTIALVSLATVADKPSTSKSSCLEYKVITQLVVTLEVGHCSLTSVTEAVTQQVAFDVVLLDSKCFPILQSETTNETEFWKSNRKILAASKTLYDKLIGTRTNPKQANIEELTSSDDDPQHRPKRLCLSNTEMFDKILEGMDALQKQNTFCNKVAAVFECVICKDIMHKPQFGACCNRAVGCQQCIRRWFEEHGTCPHCSTSVMIANYNDLKGIDELLCQVRTLCCETASSSEETASQVMVHDSDSDFELPTVSFRNVA